MAHRQSIDKIEVTESEAGSLFVYKFAMYRLIVVNIKGCKFQYGTYIGCGCRLIWLVVPVVLVCAGFTKDASLLVLVECGVVIKHVQDNTRRSLGERKCNVSLRPTTALRQFVL